MLSHLQKNSYNKESESKIGHPSCTLWLISAVTLPAFIVLIFSILFQYEPYISLIR